MTQLPGMMPTSCKSAARPPYLPQLDGLRGVAAMMVLLFHAGILSGTVTPSLAELPLIGWLQGRGWMFVDLFFVLSGYVFAQCYRLGDDLRGRGSLVRFAVARFARLWPLHATMLLFATVVMWRDPATTWQNFALSASMLHMLVKGDALNDPAWSVSVECLCYFLFALAAKRGPITLGAVTIGAVVCGIWLIWSIDGIELGRGLLGFFWGQLVFRGRARLARIPLLAFVAILATWPWANQSAEGIIYSTLVVWPAVIMIALRTQILGNDAARWLGDRSYAIYLSHIPIFYLFIAATDVFRPTTLIGGPASLLIVVATVIGASNWLYLNLERPTQKWLLGAGATTRFFAAAEPRET